MMIRALLVTLLTLCYLAAAVASENPAAGSSVIIVFNDDAMGRSADAATVKRMLLGQILEWPNGNRVRIALPSSKAPTYDAVGSQIFGGSGRAMTRLWLQKVFSGEARAPSFRDTDAEILEEIVANPNTLGVIGALPNTLPDGIRAVIP